MQHRVAVRCDFALIKTSTVHNRLFLLFQDVVRVLNFVEDYLGIESRRLKLLHLWRGIIHSELGFHHGRSSHQSWVSLAHTIFCASSCWLATHPLQQVFSISYRRLNTSQRLDFHFALCKMTWQVNSCHKLQNLLGTALLRGGHWIQVVCVAASN